MSSLNIFEEHLKSKNNESTIFIPELWNKYIGFENFNQISENVIEVNEIKFYICVLERIRQLKSGKKSEDIKDSQIYCAMPRYTMAWDIKNNGNLSNGTLVRMLFIMPMLKEMSINVLYLLPVTEYSNRNKKGDIGSPFAIKDFYKLDPNLHDHLVDDIENFTINDEFHLLIEASHILGIRVVIDFIPRVTARDCNIIKEHPDWVYWINKKYEKDFLTPFIQGLDFFQECTVDNMEQVYKAETTQKHLKQFVPPPNEKDSEEWKSILNDVDNNGEDLFDLIEKRLGITTPPAHSDWINDVQPIWTDITFWKLFLDNNEKAAKYVDQDQPPYVMFDTIKANKFPAKVPNQELWNLFTDVLEYYTKEFKLDGFRFDIGHTLPKELLEKLFDKVRTYTEDPIFISEDLFNRNHENAFNTGYNIMLGGSWKEMECLNKKNYEKFLSELSKMKIHAYACTETHDTPRIVSRKGGINLARGLAIVNNFVPNGVHFILTGYEVNEIQPMNCGLADNTGGAKIDKAFFNNISINWTSKNAYEMLDYLINVNKKRMVYKELVRPENFKLLDTDDKCIGFSYNDKLLVFLNLDFTKESIFTILNLDFDQYNEVINSGRENYKSIVNNHTIQLVPAGATLLIKI